MKVLSMVPIVLVAGLLAGGGCATTGAGSIGDLHLISAEEVDRSDARSAYELIEYARPRWLQQRFDTSVRLPTVILVYQNNQLLGGVEMLRELPVQGIHSIRWLDSAEAGRLPGAGSRHVDAAIVVSTAPDRSE